MESKDIVAIIKAGAVAKVTELEYNGLKIKYLQPESIKEEDFNQSPSTPSLPDEPTPLTKFQQEFEREQLMFTNPAAYEDSLTNGDGNEDTNG